MLTGLPLQQAHRSPCTGAAEQSRRALARPVVSSCPNAPHSQHLAASLCSWQQQPQRQLQQQQRQRRAQLRQVRALDSTAGASAGGGGTQAATAAAPPAAQAPTPSPSAAQDTSSSPSSSLGQGDGQEVQEVKGLHQLLLQQQQLISALQQDVQELRQVVIQQQQQQAAAASSSSSSSSRSPTWSDSSRSGSAASLQTATSSDGGAAAAAATPPSTPPASRPPPLQAAAATVVAPPRPPSWQPSQLGEQLLTAGPGQQQQQQQQPLVSSGPSAYQGLSLEVFRSLPDKIILVRHAESQGNVDAKTYSTTPDYEVPLSARGWEQAVACGGSLRELMDAEHGPIGYRLFFFTSPYCRTRQTFVGIRQAFPDANFAGVSEEIQIREQDFGNFQNPTKIQEDLAERNRFGRFYYRFPDGESGSDVYNRVSIFEDHMIRDLKAGRFSHPTSLVLVTHGLTMRVFLMRWFSWTVESFLQIYNPPNATPIIIQKIPEADFLARITRAHERRQTLQVKQAYQLRSDSKVKLKMTNTSTMDRIDLVAHNYFA